MPCTDQPRALLFVGNLTSRTLAGVVMARPSTVSKKMSSKALVAARRYLASVDQSRLRLGEVVLEQIARIE